MGVSQIYPSKAWERENLEMAAPKLSSLLSLTDANIDSEVASGWSGVYALDATDKPLFVYSYVGRSDSDVNKRLHDWVGEYKYFKYAYCSSPKAAFEAECELYHDHKPPDNVNHPARPANSNWVCPRCYIFD